MADTNPNILFKRGLQANLPANGSAIDGAFYLTTDTNRLYAGIGTNIVDLNKYIRTFNDLTTLESDWKNPQTGDFAYIKEGNILATYTTLDGKNQWVQINPDTDNDTKISAAAFEKATTTENGKEKIVWTLKLTQTDKNGTVITETVDGEKVPKYITTTLELSEEDITKLATSVAVGLEAEATTNGASIKTNGTGASDPAVTLVGAGATTVSVDNGTIKINSVDTNTTYNIGTEADNTNGKIVLTDSDTAKTTVTVKGDNWIGSASDANGNVSLTHKGPAAGALITPDGVTEDVDATKKETIAAAAKDTPSTFIAVTGVKADEKGHITNLETTEFTLPNSNLELSKVEGELTVTNGETDTTEKYLTTVVLKDVDGASKGSVTVNTANTITVDGVSYIVHNGENIGSFYSAGAIDNKLKALDALTYKGTVGSEADLAAITNPSLGDVYKVSAAFGNYEIGDLLIANGTEKDSDGLIYGDVTWDHISTGADTDTTYKLKVDQPKRVDLEASTGGKQPVTFTDDDYIEVTTSENAREGDTPQINIDIKHALITPTDETKTKVSSHGETIDVITKVSKNAAGHVTGVETTQLTLPAAPGAEQLNLADGEIPAFSLTDADGGVFQTVKFIDSDKIDVDGAFGTKKNDAGEDVPDTNVLEINVQHKTLETPAADTPTADDNIALDGKDSIKALTGVKVDAYGHVTGYQSTTFNLPEDQDTTYKLETNATEQGNPATIKLIDKFNVATQVTLESKNDNLTVVATAANKIEMNFTWGTF